MEKFLNSLKKLIPTRIFKALQPVYHFLLSWVAAFLYGYPSERMLVVGITGTTGKTSSVHIMAKMLRGLGYKVGYTSTAIFSDGESDRLNDKKMTMAGRMFTQKMLKKMFKNGCRIAIVETTSEGIKQFRHRFINYDWVLFTGLYPEHIEAHGSFEEYKKAKGRLFSHLGRCATKYADDDLKVKRKISGFKKIDLNRIKKRIVANLDDEHASYFLSFRAEEKIGYTLKEEVEAGSGLPDELKIIHYSEAETDDKGINFETLGENMHLSLYGKFNAANAMNAISVAFILNQDGKSIKKALAKVDGVPGRMERIDEGQDFTVIVDYAFEPNAMEKLYETVEDIPRNKIIQVLGGTGGGRDKDRRGKIGEIAGKRADMVIVTNEDPYDEDPEKIMEQVAAGALKAGKKEGKDLFRLIDRGAAIKKALSAAEKEDIVLITGKGCEQAICIACGRKIKWDDRQAAREALTEL